MPVIHHRLTGGSLYNNRILAYLESHCEVQTHIDAGGNSLDTAGGIWVADSLCLRSFAEHSTRFKDAVGVLIAHYLQAIDPSCASSAGEELAALNMFQAVITTSEFSRKALQQAGFQGAVRAVLPGLDSSYRTPTPLRGTAPVRILTIATLLPDKGLMDMLAVLSSLRDLDWSWEIAGDSELDREFAREFEERVRASTVAGRVWLRGCVPPADVMAAYDRSHIFALPSRFESCSMATMEAMARGLPVVAFRVGGLPHLLPEACRAALLEPSDWDGFSAKLRSLINNPDQRLKSGDANRVASARFPSWEESGTAVLRFLEELNPSREVPRQPGPARGGNG
jgi:glycosyltransferase involved in cell wall biosynthesis